MSIKHERAKCIGCGACVSVCPENWEMADDGKSKCKDLKSSAECNKKAAASCPVKCISVS